MTKFSTLAHRDHAFCSPISSERADRVLALLDLTAGARVLDVGCGKGELLLRCAARYGAEVYYRRLALDPDPVDTQYGLNLRDRYNDGFLTPDFIREEFGERAVFTVLPDPDRSFGRRLAVAAGVPFEEFMSRLEAWKAWRIRQFSEAR